MHPYCCNEWWPSFGQDGLKHEKQQQKLLLLYLFLHFVFLCCGHFFLQNYSYLAIDWAKNIESGRGQSNIMYKY